MKGERGWARACSREKGGGRGMDVPNSDGHRRRSLLGAAAMVRPLPPVAAVCAVLPLPLLLLVRLVLGVVLLHLLFVGKEGKRCCRITLSCDKGYAATRPERGRNRGMHG